MIVNIETQFNADWDTIIHYLSQSKTLAYINSPLVVFEPIDTPHPEVWTPGTYTAKMKLFKRIPFGRQTIVVEMMEGIHPDEHIVRDNGYGDHIRVWDHWVLVKKTDNPHRVIYIDRIDIKAGLLTPFIALFSQILYRWRQHRWKHLIHHHFAPLGEQS